MTKDTFEKKTDSTNSCQHLPTSFAELSSTLPRTNSKYPPCNSKWGFWISSAVSVDETPASNFPWTGVNDGKLAYLVQHKKHWKIIPESWLILIFRCIWNAKMPRNSAKEAKLLSEVFRGVSSTVHNQHLFAQVCRKNFLNYFLQLNKYMLCFHVDIHYSFVTSHAAVLSKNCFRCWLFPWQGSVIVAFRFESLKEEAMAMNQLQAPTTGHSGWIAQSCVGGLGISSGSRHPNGKRSKKSSGKQGRLITTFRKATCHSFMKSLKSISSHKKNGPIQPKKKTTWYLPDNFPTTNFKSISLSHSEVPKIRWTLDNKWSLRSPESPSQYAPLAPVGYHFWSEWVANGDTPKEHPSQDAKRYKKQTFYRYF